jgi:DNA-binding transcriptional LysR family regulator
VTLTQAGRALLPAARRALTAADEGRDAVAGVRGVLRGQLHVGAIQTLGVIDLPALLAGFRRAHPGVTIRLSHDAASVLASAAADAQLDIAFIDCPTDPARLTRVEIGHDDMVLAVPRGDPLAKRASIGLGDPALRVRDFVDYRADSALRAQIDVACAAAGLARRTVCEAQNMQYLAELVQHGLGISVLPPMSVRSVTAQVSIIPSRRRCAATSARSSPPRARQREPPKPCSTYLPPTSTADAVKRRNGRQARRPPHDWNGSDNTANPGITTKSGCAAGRRRAIVTAC